ncbi:MAG: CoB--CoM heterodisulfide reductase iron-sulfur subunit B family protein [Anaerolineales bacterium]
MSYSFYPGCSLHSTGIEYRDSTTASFARLGLELEELPEWNCCGASSAHFFSHTLAITLPARNLRIAQKAGKDLAVACAACYNRLRAADRAMRLDPQMRAKVENVVGFTYDHPVRIRPTLAVLAEDLGWEKVSAQIKQPLRGLKVVSYYGCLLVRPPDISGFDDPDNPQVMPGLLGALGAEVMPWSNATDCCGAGLSLSRSDVVRGLVGRLADRCLEAGAQAFVTACPLCQVNLEMRQPQAEKVPSFYFTELLGLALGLPEAQGWWGKHLIDPRPLLRSLSLAQ